MAEIAPYGSWVSPITAELAASGSMTFTGVALDGDDLYWIEHRPDEAGRATVMRRRADGVTVECTPAGYDVGTGVHEYGGGAFTVRGGTIYFANSKDQRLYRQEPGKPPECLTNGDGFRYADLQVDELRGRLHCVREDHTVNGEPVNTIVAVSFTGAGDGLVLLAGNDFYSTARLSPDGTQLAYLTWNHPNMPWDGCELHVTSLDRQGIPVHDLLIAGGPTEAIFQPEWSPGGVLHYVAEHTGWWNLYRWSGSGAEAICPRQAEFGRAMWLFGYSTYGFVDENNILCCYTQEGIDCLGMLDASDGTLRVIPSDYTEIDFIRCAGDSAAFVGGSSNFPSTVVRMDLRTQAIVPVQRALNVNVDTGYISKPETVSFISSGGRTAHALYYPPQNRDFNAGRAERPPLIVVGHGGPTSAASTSLRYAIQYWTSRGFALADVNYGGSTGYGRDYRQSLNGNWGLVDVEDCCAAALFLADRGSVDRGRLIIKGRSAGGFTAFACLAFRNDVFAAGVSHCGVADLEIFTRDTHKFESHYLETLVGPYPDRRDLYQARSPIHFTERLRCPLILFQGANDRIVPPEQSATMFDAVRGKGLPTAYVILEGEGHVFRQAGTWKRIFESELYFFAMLFRFQLGESVTPIAIENLPD